ncbi:hypothetical protein GCM10011379_05780 [Filimonas zeae]|uniref:Uncharacterized protein n=2 Tax=Filimonas zeae TaxID=1737353 RepID=A0A917IPY1_9BACT|nr:hypothetical protein GCM10011379_05780 [Filimonas zeae]
MWLSYFIPAPGLKIPLLIVQLQQIKPKSANMEWVVVIVIGLIALLIYTSIAKKNLLKQMEQEGYDVTNRIENIRYLSGHPDIDNGILFSSLFKRGDFLYIMQATYALKWQYKFSGSIPLSDITNITLMDESYTTSEWVTRPDYFNRNQTRTVQENTRHEAARLRISWRDGRFLHQTTFAYRGYNAINKATKARNILIRHIQQPA